MRKSKLLAIVGILAVIQGAAFVPGSAKPLQAGIEEEDFRITPDQNRTDAGESAPASDPLRIARTPSDEEDSDSKAGVALKGLADSDDFTPNNFEIGADRNSREMVLAWERWHHQLTQAMYTRWRAINRFPGRATMRITVTRDRHISAETLRNRGGRRYEAAILEAINSLDNNPGLTFPAKSERQVVTFDCNLTAGHVPAGYTWDKRDFEKIRQDD